MVTDLFIPVSLACRMFGNLLGGFIIMHLVYSVLVSLVRNYFYTVLPVALAAVLPGILSIYFGVFHVLIQAYIFLMLTLTFVREASE